MKTLTNTIIDFFYPNYCVVCRDLTQRNSAICQACEQDLPWNHQACFRCGNTLDPLENNLSLCGECLIQPPKFYRTIAPLLYEQPIVKFITQLKFHHQLLYAKLLGQLLAERIKRVYTNTELPECIVPMPLHKKRIKQRGFNQAIEIAKPIAKALHLTINHQLCRRKKNTQAQSSLTGESRKLNIHNAFEITNNLNVKHIAVLDDVITTGNTIRALSETINTDNKIKIDIWCCARVGVKRVES